MLRTSKLTDYATVILAYLADDPARQYAAADVAEAVGIALPTVSKVLKTLTRGSLLSTTRGAKGGYRLAYPAVEISLSRIIEVMEGPIALTECSVSRGLCVQESHCSLRANWRRINRLVMQALDGVTLADMASPQLQTMTLKVSKSSSPTQRR